MSTLADAIGALVAEVTRARMAADLETTRIARIYQADPLLKHLSVPRFRLPEIQMDVPVVLQGYRSSGGTTTVEAVPDKALRELAAAVTEQVRSLVKSFDVDPSSVEKLVERALAPFYEDATDHSSAEQLYEALYGPISTWFAATPAGRDERRVRSFRAKLAYLLPRTIESFVRSVPVTSSEQLSALDATLETAVVREVGDPTLLAVLRLKVVEDGLEWATVTSADGEDEQRLVPE